MKLGYESKRHGERLAKKYIMVDDYYLSNGMNKTIKMIQKKYGYSVSAAARLFHEVVG